MAATTSLTVTNVGGSNPFPATITDSVTNPVPSEQPLTLALGDNIVDLPTGTTYVCVAPVTGNTVALKVKGASGDTGIGTFLIGNQTFHLDGAAPASIVINAATAGAKVVVYGL